MTLDEAIAALEHDLERNAEAFPLHVERVRVILAALAAVTLKNDEGWRVAVRNHRWHQAAQKQLQDEQAVRRRQSELLTSLHRTLSAHSGTSWIDEAVAKIDAARQPQPPTKKPDQ